MENNDLQNTEGGNSDSELETQILHNDELNADEEGLVKEDDRNDLLSEESVSITPSNRSRKVYSGMWGIPEIIAVGLASIAVLSVLLIYLFLVVPAESDLEKNRVKRDSMEKEKISFKKKFGDMEETETKVSKLINSASDFETRYLKNEMTGKSAIYQRINGLINSLGLTNTTGPDYVPLEISEDERRSGQNGEGQRGRSKFQSLFPGVYVTMTVEGSYFSLRRFIQEVEKSNEFIIISTIELEPAEDKGDGDEKTVTVTEVDKISGETKQIKKQLPSNGKTRGKVVSLRLEMAAYFQRPADQRANTSPLPSLNDSDELN